MNDAAKLYAASFTERNSGRLAFYKSPLGKKVIMEEPVILDERTERRDLGFKVCDEVMAANSAPR
jgi:hypothetical protein